MFKRGKDKKRNSVILLKEPKREMKEEGDAVGDFVFFRVRECHFSLGLRAIRPSKSFEPRRKVVLHGEAYAWTPVSWSFDKLREVGDFSYLVLHLV